MFAVLVCLVGLLDARGRRSDYWEVWGSAIYWNPCAGSYVVGVSGEEVQLVGTDGEWGFRAGAAYLMCDGSSFLAGEYTRFDATYSTTVAKREFRYETIDARMGIALCADGCDKFYAVLTGRYLDLQESRTSGPSGQESLLVGGAGLIGAGGLHPLSKCVYLCAEASGLLGIGEQTTRQSGRRIPSETSCFPGLEGRAGLRYVLPAQGHCLFAEVGYEVLYYWAALRRWRNDGELERDDVGFHGAYATLRLRF